MATDSKRGTAQSSALLAFIEVSLPSQESWARGFAVRAAFSRNIASIAHPTGEFPPMRLSLKSRVEGYRGHRAKLANARRFSRSNLAAGVAAADHQLRFLPRNDSERPY
jgi:hypothetical protein